MSMSTTAVVEYIDRHSLSPELRRERLEASCLLAAHLLWPEFVRDICVYWIDNYSNYTDVESEEDMFNELIAQLLAQRPQLKQHVGEGMIHRSCNTYFYPSYVQLLGGGKHCWPTEYNERMLHLSFTEALHRLTQPHLVAFGCRVPAGLTGEQELSGFVHDAVLEYCYEPALVVTTAYMLHLQALVAVTGAREPIDWLPRHYHSLRALEEPALAALNCLGDRARLETLRGELRELYDVLNTPLLQRALDGVQQLWSRKASYCWSQIFVRLGALLAPAGAYAGDNNTH